MKLFQIFKRNNHVPEALDNKSYSLYPAKTQKDQKINLDELRDMVQKYDQAYLKK